MISGEPFPLMCDYPSSMCCNIWQTPRIISLAALNTRPIEVRPAVQLYRSSASH